MPHSENRLRDSITNAYRMDETACLNRLIPLATLPDASKKNIKETTKRLILNAREYKKTQSNIDLLLHQYDLSTDEGIALMCLAESLLRIPDKETIDKLISDKISTADWKSHLSMDNSFLVNSATWSLLFTGKMYAPTLDTQKNLLSALKRLSSRIGAAMIRPIILKMMKAIGNQFVVGETIQSALTNAAKLEAFGYSFSYDMLGEAARTFGEAQGYYEAYLTAIQAIGRQVRMDDPIKNSGISIKLSGLHPRYEYTQRERVLKELPPILLSLVREAKKYNINVTVDAEEADRLDLSLDIFKLVYEDASLKGWDGFGLAVQAYQKRAFYVIEWLAELAKQHKKRIPVRLIKGAYWDSEIKQSQVQGLVSYPVFTRKNATDVSFIACAKQLISYADRFYCEFGTHNAYSAAAIMEMTKTSPVAFEFQCLYGMGRPLYDQIIKDTPYHCRIYAPVGTHEDLLGYLVRRLLENGANSSFLHRLADEKTPLDTMLIDPVARMDALPNKPHPEIPLPKNIYVQWQNSEGLDLSDAKSYSRLELPLAQSAARQWSAASIINGKIFTHNHKLKVASPSDQKHHLGDVYPADPQAIEKAVQIASSGMTSWGRTEVRERAALLEKAAQLFQEEMPELIALLAREGGRCLLDCISEVRETIDYCRYYAYRARQDLLPIPLPGPTGESNQLSLHPRGLIVCISPWNFPLAIFTGQITAALVTGNAVIAKPAEQTPLIAFKAIQILHRAGFPKEILHLLIGAGDVGAQLVKRNEIAGVMFTGSTETAKLIEQSLANRTGPIAVFVAETGGQNAMIVDSSALPEQTVIDIAQSAFNSAGQRCSALRVLCVQEAIAPRLLDLLKGFMQELRLGDPTSLAADIGPVIDGDALKMLQTHFSKMVQQGKLLAQVPKNSLADGFYFAPCAFEINDFSVLKREVFGPILHIIRYKARNLDQLMDAIIKTGYGLTLGVESRISSTADFITSRMPVGNMYVNRNMIGAVVGVQPFGGERLSGTGPKAGGPHYLPRLCVERAISTNTAAIGGNARLVSLREEE